MPRVAPYIPPKDADLANWAANFATLIAAAPATYGLTAGDATAITGVQSAFATAYTTAINHATRTPVTVSAKNAAKVNLLATVRPYGQTISLNAGVTTGNKIALGLNPRTTSPTPITPPTTYPAIDITQGASLTHVVRYRDSAASPSVKSKPYGVQGVQLFAFVSPFPTVLDWSFAFLKATLTKNPLNVSWGDAQKNHTIAYCARYILSNGQLGPWGNVVTANVFYVGPYVPPV